MFCFLFFAAVRLLEDYTENGITYSLDSTTNTASITGSTCPDTDTSLTIPQTVTSGEVSYRVTEIGDDVFEGCIHYIGDLLIP